MAFGISFGLGTGDVIRNITAGSYVRGFLRVGSRMHVVGQTGVLAEIYATHAILQAEDREISVANTTFLETAAQSWPEPAEYRVDDYLATQCGCGNRPW